jgi:hypothetical protein
LILNNLFSLDKVCHLSITINASHEESRTCSMATASRN